MTSFKLAIIAAFALGIFLPSVASAHIVPWRKGESRQLGYGQCSKGPCTTKTCWAPSRPHRHVGNAVIFVSVGPPECWR